MNYPKFLFILFAFLLTIISNNVNAKIWLPSVFSDNMVLQQQTNAAIWGKATANKKVSILTSWNSKQYSAVADQDGNWKIKVLTPVFGGPYLIKISDGEELNLKNILIGDVWICSGQSNMEMPLAGWGKIQNYEKEISDANYPNIRLLQVEHVTSNSPLDDAKVANNGWQECNPKFIADFSSTAYFFARSIYQKTKIPIGLIHTSWGGTIAEAWTSASSLKQMPDFVKAIKTVEESAKQTSTLTDEQKLNAWLKNTFDKDLGYKNGEPIYALTNTKDWKTMNVPGAWENAGLKDLDGVVWFSKKVTVHHHWIGKEVNLNLSTVDDNDITWVNGIKVGETDGYGKARRYAIPNNLLKEGENTITIRVLDSGGDGGLLGEAKDFNLKDASGETISLAGDWQYSVGLNLKDVDSKPASANNPNQATVLYNAMIHPFIQFSIKGAIWYQGESNADRAKQYQELFPLLIKDWRSKWKQGNFPFYFVQLANFMNVESQPLNSPWAELREAQSKTLSLPNTGMAVIIDIGNDKDIHPKNKQEVGRRLALIAEAKNYNQKVAFTGPVYQAKKIETNAIRISFKIEGNQLKTADGKEVSGFAVAGADQKFYWAKATISGNEVIVSSDRVIKPIAVRYAWANNPICNLTDDSGLPASPFRAE